MNESTDQKNLIRAAFIETGSGHGGSAYSLLRIVQAMRHDYGDVLHATVLGYGDAGVEIFKADGFDTIALSHHTMPIEFMAARSLFREHKFQLIHCNNTPYTHKAFVLAAWSLHLPLTVHVRSSRDITHSEQFILRRSGHCFAVSKSAMDVLQMQSRTLPERMTCLGDGTLIEEFQKALAKRDAVRGSLDIPEGRLTVLLSSTLQSGKGQDTALQAASLLKGRGRKIHWLFAGGEHFQSKGYEEQLHQRVNKLGLQKNVSLLGYRSDIPFLLAACDVAILPTTLTEGLPCVVMEAMAAGRPVLASDIGGIPESVDDSVGTLLPPGDVNALAAAVETLDEDRELLQRKGEAAMQRAQERFSIRDKAKVLMDVYQSLLAGAKDHV